MRTAAVKGEMNMAQKVQKVRSKLEKKGYSGIECTEVGKCIRLEGEMTEWTDIVKAGKAAAKFGYKGVLNDISLKGFTEPAIRAEIHRRFARGRSARCSHHRRRRHRLLYRKRADPLQAQYSARRQRE